MLRGRWDDLIETHAIALSCAVRLGDWMSEAELLEAIGDAIRIQQRRDREPDRAEFPEIHPTPRHRWPPRDVAEAQRDESALTIYDDARALYAELGDQLRARDVTDKAMRVARDRAWGEPTEALSYFEDAVRHYREYDEPRRLAGAINDLGICCLRTRRTREALDLLHEAHELRRDHGTGREQAESLVNLGSAYWAQGDNAGAIRQYQRAAALFEETDDTEGLADALYNEGVVHLRSGRVRKAREAWLTAARSSPSSGELGEAAGELRVVARWKNSRLRNTVMPITLAAVPPMVVGVATQRDDPADDASAAAEQEAGPYASWHEIELADFDRASLSFSDGDDGYGPSPYTAADQYGSDGGGGHGSDRDSDFGFGGSDYFRD